MMKKVAKVILGISLFLILSLGIKSVVSAQVDPLATEQNDSNPVIVHVFTSRSCPHCAREKQFLQQLKTQRPEVIIYNYEIENRANALLLSLIGQELDQSTGGVPFTVVGRTGVVGFRDANTTGQQIISLVEQQQQNPNQLDIAALADEINQQPVRQEIEAEPTQPKPSQNPTSSPTHTSNPSTITTGSPSNSDQLAQKPDNQNNDNHAAQVSGTSDSVQPISLPVIGEVDPSQLSLPLLTVVLGFLDGFNPCAMWTLLFLISLLLGMENKARRWLLGIAFIVASGFVYFLFMSAWLNLFLFIGVIYWVRIIIGAVALGAGGYYLYDYCVNKTGACKVEMGGTKKKVFTRLKQFTQQENLLIAILGIILLAFAVNLIELICSAGLPAVYTNVLSLSDLTTWQYYGYIFIYILVFMLDDLFIFFVAMTTLNQVGINGKYSRYSHLIGGILMLAIGLALWFKPELLTFG